MMTFSNDREAYLWGQQQMDLIPEPYRQAYLRGVRDRAYKGKRQQGNFLDPEVEEAYNKLLSAYGTKTAIAKAIGINLGNLHRYITGQSPVGPELKGRFLSAAAAVPAVPAVPAAG